MLEVGCWRFGKEELKAGYYFYFKILGIVSENLAPEYQAKPRKKTLFIGIIRFKVHPTSNIQH